MSVMQVVSIFLDEEWMYRLRSMFDLICFGQFYISSECQYCSLFQVHLTVMTAHLGTIVWTEMMQSSVQQAITVH